MMQAKQDIAPPFCLKTITTGTAETFLGGAVGGGFLLNITGLSVVWQGSAGGDAAWSEVFPG